MTRIAQSIFIVLACSLLLPPSSYAQKRDVKVECFKTKHRDDPAGVNACRVQQDLYIPQTQNVILECESFVDFQDAVDYRAYAELSLQVGNVTKQRTRRSGPDSEPQKERSKLSVYWDGEISRGVQRFSCQQENQYGDCLQTRMCVYY
jgi:hypothetical protein